MASIHRPSDSPRHPRPIPAYGPPRVEAWRAWRAAVAADAAGQLRLIAEAGAAPDDLRDWAEHYEAWLAGQLRDAVREGLAWAEAWTP